MFIKKFRENPTFNKIYNNMSWLLFEKVFRMGTSLFVGVWIARYLGPQEYGLLNYAQAYVALFTALAALGMDNIVIRNLVKDPVKKNYILGTSFTLKLISGVLTTLVSIFLFMIIEPGDRLIFYLVSIISLSLVFQSFNTIDFWFQSRVKSKYTVIARSISFSSVSVIKILLIIFDGSLIAFAVVTSLELALNAVCLIFIYFKNEGSIREWRFSIKIAKNLMKDSWPLILSGLAVMLYMRIDQIMLGNMVSAEEVGIYSVAIKLAEMWYFIPGIIITSTFPLIISSKENPIKYKERLQTLYDIMATIGYLVAIPMTFLSPLLINILYGEAYANAAIILSIYIWIGIFVNLGLARTAFLNVENWTKIHFLSSVSGCILNVILNLIFIPHYGGIGAAYASLISYWFQAHSIGFFIPKLHDNTYRMTKAILIPFRFRSLLDTVRKGGL